MTTVPPDFPDEGPLDLRLARVLGRQVPREGGFAGLARAISLANPELRKKLDEKAKERSGYDAEAPQPEREVIDRRKLKRLIEGEDVVLAISELRALDRYLDRIGEGLAYRPIFARPDLLQALADSGHVTFLIGSRQMRGAESGSFAVWDVLALAEVQRSLSALGRSLTFDIQEVPFDAPKRRPKRWIQEEGERLRRESGAVVCIASSRTNAAFELIMGAATGCEPYTDCSLEEKRALPFGFAWNSSLEVSPSAFWLRPEEIADLDEQIAQRVRAAVSTALVVGKDIFEDTVMPNKWGTTHGLVVAYRPAEAGLRLCIAGVTGPGTLCAARMANRLTLGIHGAHDGRESDVYFSVIRGRIAEKQKNNFASLREFGEEVLIPARRWKRSS